MLTRDGRVYARVSDILKPFVNFEGIDEEVLKRKAALGTRVHDAIKQEIDGELAVVLPQEQGYVQSFEKWRRALNPTFVETEVRRYCNKKMITGCIDALVKFQGEEKCVLIDWKTSVAESPITWPMQAHLYDYLLQSDGIPISHRYLFIKLDKHGNMPTVFQYKFDTNILARCFQAIDKFWKEKTVAINSQ